LPSPTSLSPLSLHDALPIWLRAQLPQLFAVYDEGKCSFSHLSAVKANLRLLPVELWGDVDGPLAVVAPMMTASELAEYLLKLARSEEHTSELQSQSNLVCRL